MGIMARWRHTGALGILIAVCPRMGCIQGIAPDIHQDTTRAYTKGWFVALSGPQYARLVTSPRKAISGATNYRRCRNNIRADAIKCAARRPWGEEDALGIQKYQTDCNKNPPDWPRSLFANDAQISAWRTRGLCAYYPHLDCSRNMVLRWIFGADRLPRIMEIPTSAILRLRKYRHVQHSVFGSSHPI